eukprot:jgi/Astpho2/5057/fgenesh1_pg.00071_%23_36_t
MVPVSCSQSDSVITGNQACKEAEGSCKTDLIVPQQQAAADLSSGLPQVKPAQQAHLVVVEADVGDACRPQPGLWKCAGALGLRATMLQCSVCQVTCKAALCHGKTAAGLRGSQVSKRLHIAVPSLTFRAVICLEQQYPDACIKRRSFGALTASMGSSNSLAGAASQGSVTQPRKQAQGSSKFCNSALQSLPATAECCAVRAQVLQTPVSWFWLTRRKVSAGQLGSEQLPRTAGRDPDQQSRIGGAASHASGQHHGEGIRQQRPALPAKGTGCLTMYETPLSIGQGSTPAGVAMARLAPTKPTCPSDKAPGSDSAASPLTAKQANVAAPIVMQAQTAPGLHRPHLLNCGPGFLSPGPAGCSSGTNSARGISSVSPSEYATHSLHRQQGCRLDSTRTELVPCSLATYSGIAMMAPACAAIGLNAPPLLTQQQQHMQQGHAAQAACPLLPGHHGQWLEPGQYVRLSEVRLGMCRCSAAAPPAFLNPEAISRTVQHTMPCQASALESGEQSLPVTNSSSYASSNMLAGELLQVAAGAALPAVLLAGMLVALRRAGTGAYLRLVCGPSSPLSERCSRLSRPFGALTRRRGFAVALASGNRSWGTTISCPALHAPKPVRWHGPCPETLQAWHTKGVTGPFMGPPLCLHFSLAALPSDALGPTNRNAPTPSICTMQVWGGAAPQIKQSQVHTALLDCTRKSQMWLAIFLGCSWCCCLLEAFQGLNMLGLLGGGFCCCEAPAMGCAANGMQAATAASASGKPPAPALVSAIWAAPCPFAAVADLTALPGTSPVAAGAANGCESAPVGFSTLAAAGAAEEPPPKNGWEPPSPQMPADKGTEEGVNCVHTRLECERKYAVCMPFNNLSGLAGQQSRHAPLGNCRSSRVMQQQLEGLQITRLGLSATVHQQEVRCGQNNCNRAGARTPTALSATPGMQPAVLLSQLLDRGRSQAAQPMSTAGTAKLCKLELSKQVPPTQMYRPDMHSTACVTSLVIERGCLPRKKSLQFELGISLLVFLTGSAAPRFAAPRLAAPRLARGTSALAAAALAEPASAPALAGTAFALAGAAWACPDVSASCHPQQGQLEPKSSAPALVR